MIFFLCFLVFRFSFYCLHVLCYSHCTVTSRVCCDVFCLRRGLTFLRNGQWLQASLQVENGGLGVRSAMMLAPSAFLASAASTLELQQSILPEGISSSACPLPFNGEMRSRSSARSLPPINHPLQSFLA